MPEGSKVVAVCDVYRPRAEAVGGKYHAKAFYDFHRILDRKDVDAVVIATPDHWHALPAVLACQAGKDVYCEKPLALTVHEGRVMVQAARKHRRVFAVGTQQRSLKPDEIACRLVRSGTLGKVKKVVVHDYPGPSGAWLPREEVPEGLDWNEWLGQAPADLPFNGKYLFPENEPGWSSCYAFSGGEMCGWGAHGFDMIQWALGMDNSGPVEVYSGDAPDQPDDAPVRWMYPGGITVETGDAPRAGGWIYCERGEIHIDRNRFHVLPDELGRELLRGVDVAESVESDHMRDFLGPRRREVHQQRQGERTSRPGAAEGVRVAFGVIRERLLGKRKSLQVAYERPGRSSTSSRTARDRFPGASS
jgi:predicted dehydrogenase